MITIIFFITGFFTADGVFGAQVISGFDMAQWPLWLGSIILSILTLILTIGGAAISSLGDEGVNTSKGVNYLAAVGGGIVGGALGVLTSSLVISKLWLTYYIIDHIPATATKFSEFGDNAQYGIYAFILLLLMSFFISNKTNK